MIGRPILVIGLAVGALNIAAMALTPRDYAIAQVPWTIAIVPMFIVSVLLISRARRNTIGPLLFVIAVLGTFGNLPGLADRSGGEWFGPIGAALSTFGISLLPLVILLFPDGILLSTSWRPVVWFTFITAGVGAVLGFLVGGWGGDANQALVLGVFFEETRAFTDPGLNVYFAILTLSVCAAAISASVRYARGSTVIRHQIRWLLMAASTLALIALLLLVNSGAESAATGWRAFALGIGLATIPTAVGIAVLRYRLYDIDVVISRSLVFVVLVGFITVVYAAVVVGIGSAVGGSSVGWSIAATALVAVVFEPVRDRVQRWVNRLVYGRRATPYEVLSDLTGRLAATEREEGLLDRMAQRLAEGTGADRAVVWVGEGDGFHAAACEPAGARPIDVVGAFDRLPGAVVPIVHDGVVLGALSVESRRGDALTPTEQRLVEDLAGSAGLLMRRLHLDAALEQKATELEESRRRLVNAQDVERRRLERELNEGAQQQVVALKVQLGLAEQRARGEGSDKVAGLIAQMAAETQDAIDQIRALANGIYPPLLEAEGLAAAVTALAEAAPVEVRVEERVSHRYPLPIEGAVYFCISEALTNAVKHGSSPIAIDLSDASGDLVFSVSDAGPGFDPDQVERGSGLNNMADRLDALAGSVTIESTPGNPTIVTGRVPVIAEAGVS